MVKTKKMLKKDPCLPESEACNRVLKDVHKERTFYIKSWTTDLALSAGHWG